MMERFTRIEGSQIYYPTVGNISYWKDQFRKFDLVVSKKAIITMLKMLTNLEGRKRINLNKTHQALLTPEYVEILPYPG